MVRALPNSPWHLTEFLGRVRPGLAVSVAMHAALLLTLAYLLAFAPPKSPSEPTPPEIVTMFAIQPAPPKVQPTHTNDLKLDKTPKLTDVHADMRSIEVPPVNLDREPKEATTITPSLTDVILDPQPIYRGGLEYPERAADSGRSGYVDFTFTIEPDGSVGDPQIVSEVPPGYGFAAAARKAFATWRFEPMKRNGKPVAAPARIRVSFELK